MTASQEVRIARSLLREGMYAQAEGLLLAGFANLRIQIGDTHPDTNVARELLRELYTNMGRPLDAEQYAEIPAPGE